MLRYYMLRISGSTAVTGFCFSQTRDVPLVRAAQEFALLSAHPMLTADLIGFVAGMVALLPVFKGEVCLLFRRFFNEFRAACDFLSKL